MAELNLSKYGISGTTEIVHNPSYEMLFAEETKPGLEGYEVGQVSELGAVNVMTGIYTGRSPKDKYIVVDDNSKDRTTTTPCPSRSGRPSRIWLSASCATRSCTWSTPSAAPTRTPAWPSASSWRSHGRHISSPICSSARLRRSWKTSSRTSSSTTRPRPRSRTIRSWASTPRPASPSTSPAVSRSSSTPGTAAR